MSSIQIRRATLHDLDVLQTNNMAMALESENKILSQETLRAGLISVLQDPSKGFYIVAERNGEVVGNLMVTVEWSDWRNAPMWWFQSVFVVPEARREGVFAAMYHHVHEQACISGVKELRLYVEKENLRAQKTYQALGMNESHYLMYEISL
jgi:GNAT superfamily N-acetyltransferase